jgi:hypothetical protein
MFMGNHSEISDAFGSSAPAAMATPFATMPQYLNAIAEKFSVKILPGHRMRPRPKRGRAGARRVDSFEKIGFQQGKDRTRSQNDIFPVNTVVAGPFIFAPSCR